jgi:hypothetical protein
MRLFHWQRADQSPDEREEKPPDVGEGKSSKHGLKADQIELIEKLAMVALGATEPIEKLVELLMHAH